MRMRTICGLISGLLVVSFAARADIVRLQPEGSKPFGMRNVFGPLRSLVSGPGFWYGERKIEVETSPPGATLDLFYVRANFQKRYEQTSAPATILLPSRSEAGPRDSVTIRALLPGYRSKEVRIPIESDESRVMIDLDPVPNRLEGASQSYFAGRASLTFFLRQPPVVRFQDRPEGFSIVMNQTAEGPGAEVQLAGLTSPLVQRIDAQQLGEDLMVRVDLAEDSRRSKPEIRSREGFDAARQLHLYSVDLVAPSGGAGADSSSALLAALAAVSPADVTGCAAAFDAALRESLDPAELARALSPQDYRAPFLRSAMKRLGEVSPGNAIVLTDGQRFDAAVPIELAAAASQPHLAKGYLALLRRVTEELEPPGRRDASYRSLIAPEVSSDDFDKALSKAGAAEASCRQG